jgi:hypothetical protein
VQTQLATRPRKIFHCGILGGTCLQISMTRQSLSSTGPAMRYEPNSAFTEKLFSNCAGKKRQDFRWLFSKMGRAK